MMTPLCCPAQAVGDKGTPVTVKCRIGVDDKDSYSDLLGFVRTVSEKGGVEHFIIHARKAHLKGLNPHQNRTIPPLRSAAFALTSPPEAAAALLVRASMRTLFPLICCAALLRHHWVFALMRDFPALTFSINGGIGGSAEASAILESRVGAQHGVEGVMIGRAAYSYPWQVATTAAAYPPPPPLSRVYADSLNPPPPLQQTLSLHNDGTGAGSG